MIRFFAVALIFCWSCASAFEAHDFADARQERRYQNLLKELRCLVCQNQNLADSHAELAQDLRKEVAKLIKRGNSDAEIKDHLARRYGDFVLYDPPIKPGNYFLWFAPFLFLLGGAIVVFLLVRRRSKATANSDARGAEQN